MSHAPISIGAQEEPQVPNPIEQGGWHHLVEDAQSAFTQLSESFGFEAFAILDISRRLRGLMLPSIDLTNLDPAFLEHIVDGASLGECSLFRVLEQACRPFDWETGKNAFSGLVENGESSDTDQAFDALLSAFGFEGGICVPVHEPTGKRAVIIYLGANIDALQDREALIVESIKLFDSTTRFKLEQSQSTDHILSIRQSECLYLASKGASNSEIAERLEVSEHSVVAFLNAAGEKLGTQTTAQSVAKALNLKLFQP